MKVVVKMTKPVSLYV